jgi:hypothetical protein
MRKKSTVVNLFLVISLATYFVNSEATNFEGYSSEIKGVGLWRLEGNIEVGFEHFPGAEKKSGSAEFVAHCNGKNKIYVYELGGKAFVCQGHKWVASPKAERGLVDLLLEPDFKYQGEIFGTVNIHDFHDKPGLYTVSIKKIEQKKWNVSALTKSEIDAIKELAVTHIDKKARQSGYKYLQIVGKKLELAKKISLGTMDILIVPTERVTNSDEGDIEQIVSTVFSESDGSLRFLGHIFGRLKQVGPDIDDDGVPELLLESAHYEGTDVIYFKVFPVVKPLIEYQIN